MVFSCRIARSMHLGCFSTFGKRLLYAFLASVTGSKHPACMDHAIMHGKPFGIPLTLAASHDTITMYLPQLWRKVPQYGTGFVQEGYHIRCQDDSTYNAQLKFRKNKDQEHQASAPSWNLKKLKEVRLYEISEHCVYCNLKFLQTDEFVYLLE